MRNSKILILQGEISSYRVPTFNIIAENFEVTVGYITKDKSDIECKFHKHKFDTYQIGPFTFVKSLRKYCKQFDVVIFMSDFHVLSYCLLPFGCHKYKTITWGIGLRASYTRLYDVERGHGFMDRVEQKLLSSCDASIFYMDKAKEFWRKTSLDLSRVFIATNTTTVVNSKVDPLLKTNILFVGTLYREKGLVQLIDAYKEAKCLVTNILPLHIVGDGAEALYLKQYVEEKGLSDSVVFHGAIYDEELLAYHFQRALLCISPNQAGLSVPKSMGYGVPFVTNINAITGGEKYHIIHGDNGLFYKEECGLVDIIVDASKDRDKYVKMGERAKCYYENFATPKHMAQGVIDAINFVLK